MSRKILGLDIRSASATAILLETGFKTCAISGFGHVPFPEEGSFTERLSETLSAIAGSMDLKDCVCALSLPSDLFFYRNLSVPFSETKKILQMLPYELESLIALPVEDLLIDFSKLPATGPDGETRLIAAGIETARLKEIIECIEACGINPDMVFPVGYAQSVWIKGKLPPREKQIFVDMDGENCTLYLLLAGDISLIRAFPIPAAQPTSAIYLWNQVQQSIAGFESLFEMNASPELITINTPLDEKFCRQLETVSGITVEPLRLEPPENCGFPDENDESCPPANAHNGMLANALFLFEGFRGINFRKGPLASKNRIFEYRDRIIRTAIIAAVLFLFWFVGALTDIHLTQKKVNRLQAEILEIYRTHFPDSRNTEFPVYQLQSEIDALKNASMVSGDAGSQLRCIDLLGDISRSIPDSIDVDFSKLQLSGGEISIQGTTSSFNLVTDIKTKIEAIDSVVSVTSINPTREGTGDKIRFRLKIETNGEDAS